MRFCLNLGVWKNAIWQIRIGLRARRSKRRRFSLCRRLASLSCSYNVQVLQACLSWHLVVVQDLTKEQLGPWNDETYDWSHQTQSVTPWGMNQVQMTDQIIHYLRDMKPHHEQVINWGYSIKKPVHLGHWEWRFFGEKESRLISFSLCFFGQSLLR